MAVLRQCPVCGGTVATDAPSGHCPRCLFQLGLAAGEPAIVPVSEPAASEPLSFLGSRLRNFGDYELLTEIGRGGMGVVFKARQISLNRWVAVKMLLSGEWASPRFEQRFRLEAEAAASLNHPNIVAIHEVGVQEGHHYFSMDYVEGQTLAERVHDNPLPPQRAAQYLQAVAQAIHYAHQRGILHRDLKPSNILIDSLDRPRITDFGLAKRLTPSDLGPRTSDLTVTGQMLGSPSYASPEQAAGKTHELTVASDIYSLGSILYEMLTGRPPFQGETPVETLRKVLDQDPVPPRSLNPRIDRDLETVCLKCLSKDPWHRYRSAQALAEDLGRWLAGEPIEAVPAAWQEKLWRGCRRQPVVTSLTIGLALAILAGFVATVLEWQQAERAKQDTIRVNQRLRSALHQMDSIQLLRAEEYLAADDRIDALPRWALALRNNPSNQIAAERGLSALSHRTWARLACPPLQHSNRITFAFFSPDGRRVVTSSADQTAFIWDTDTGLCLTGPLKHEDEINTAMFSPDGKRVVTASQDKTARIWDVESGHPVMAPLVHEADVSSAQFSPDGKWVLTTTHGLGQFWSATTGERAGDGFEAGDFIMLARFNPDGSRLVFGCVHGQAQLWESVSRSCLHRFQHTGNVRWVSFSPDGKWLATASDDKTARVWDVQTGASVGEPLRHDGPVVSVEFSADGEWVVTASDDKTSQVWNARTGWKKGPAFPHAAQVRLALFSPDGLSVATASWDGTARIWDVASGRPRTEPMIQGSKAYEAVFHPDGVRVLTASNGKDVLLWQVAGAASLRFDVGARIGMAQFAPDNGRMVVASDAEHTRVWDALNGRADTPPLPHPAGSWVTQAIFSPDGKFVATACDDGTARIWKAAECALATGPLRGRAPIRWLAFNPHGTRLLTGGGGSAGLWNARTGALEAEIHYGDELSLAPSFSSDGTRVLTASLTGVARVWNVRSGEPVTPPLLHSTNITSAQFSPDGRYVLTAARKPSFFIWDASDGRQIETRWPHRGPVLSAVYSADGKRVLTSTSGYGAQLWNLESGLSITGEFGGRFRMRNAVFEHDERRVMIMYDDHTSQIWDPWSGQRLSEILNHDGRHSLQHQWSPDGRLLAVCVREETLEIWGTSPAPLPVPAWLPDLAEALAGQRFSEEGMLEPVRPSELWAVQQRMLAWANAPTADRTSSSPKEAGWFQRITRGASTSAVNEDNPSAAEVYYAHWVRWFLGDASTRPNLPSSASMLGQSAESVDE